MPIAKVKAGNPFDEQNVFNSNVGPFTGTGLLPGDSPAGVAQVRTSWVLPTIAPGANATLAVSVPGAQPGDYVSIYCMPSSPMPPGVVIMEWIGSSGTVTLSAFNNGTTTSVAATINLIIEVGSAGAIQDEEANNIRSR